MISLFACRLLVVEFFCARLCVFGVEPPTLDPKASRLMSNGLIRQGLVTPGADPLALQTDPALTPNVFRVETHVCRISFPTKDFRWFTHGFTRMLLPLFQGSQSSKSSQRRGTAEEKRP